MIMSIAFDDIANAALTLVETLFLMLNGLIYDFISFLYQIFLAIAGARIITNEQIQKVADNIYVLVGVVALFLVAYALIQLIINPDDSKSGGNYSMKKVIPNILKTILLLAFVPTIFNFAYGLQGVILADNVIPKLILGEEEFKSPTSNNKDLGKLEYDGGTAGNKLANYAFMSFITPKDGNNLASIETTNCWKFGKSCLSDEAYSLSKAQKDVDNGTEGFGVYAAFGDQIHQGDNKGTFSYNGFFQLITGIFMVYVFLSFCIDLGVRTVKLAYYQLIAPLPILTIIIPGQKKVFDNWLKSTLSTYADVFIRVAVIFFGIFMINMLPNLDEAWIGSFVRDTQTVRQLAKVFIIIGILIFIKQAPKLISELTGLSSGSFKLGIRDKLGEMAGVGGAVKKGLDRVEGAVTGGLGAGYSAVANKQKLSSGLKYGIAKGFQKGGNQFNAQRQGIYKDAYGGKGKAGLFGGQVLTEKKSDDIAKKTKNQFREDAKNYLIEREGRDNFKEAYNKVYNTNKAKHEQERANIAKKLNDEWQKYESIISENNSKIQEIISANPNLEVSLKNAKDQYDKELKEFNNNRDTQRNALVNDLEQAKSFGKQSQIQLAEERLRNFDSTKSKYSNPELERRINNLNEASRNLEHYKELNNEYAIRRENDIQLDQLKESLANEDKYLKDLQTEYQYINGTLKDGDGNFIKRSIKNDKDFKHFTDTIETVRGEFSKEHPTYKQYYTKNAEYEKEARTTAWLSTDEGQHMVAALGKHSGDIGKGIKVQGPPPPPPSDGK